MKILPDTDDRETDVFGLPKIDIQAEMGLSFTLFILGALLVFSVIYPLQEIMNVVPAYVGMIMIMVSYFFAIEGVRELEGKDHFLSRKLMEMEQEEPEEDEGEEEE
jgi:hypothetical protein